MKNISELVHYWISCCNDVWRKWFLNREHGAHEFAEVEEKLLELLVMSQVLHHQSRVTTRDFIKRVRVRYVQDVSGNRQVCKRQAVGNIFVKAERVMIAKGSVLSVRGIDTLGTMLNSEPYVEVVWQDGFILEPPENLEFLIEGTLEP